MKYFLTTILLFTFFIFPKSSSAHVLITDGSMGAVIHIDPEDDPIANLPSSFFFEFKDKENKFLPDHCDCQAVIYQKDKQIYSQPLFQNNQDQPSVSNASFSYTFSQQDLYTLKITGKPIKPATFTAFVLSYDIRVARTENAATTNATSLPSENMTFIIWGIIFGVIILGLLIGLILTKRIKQKN